MTLRIVFLHHSFRHRVTLALSSLVCIQIDNEKLASGY
jgi:hypothetical protein